MPPVRLQEPSGKSVGPHATWQANSHGAQYPLQATPLPVRRPARQQSRARRRLPLQQRAACRLPGSINAFSRAKHTHSNAPHTRMVPYALTNNPRTLRYSDSSLPAIFYKRTIQSMAIKPFSIRQHTDNSSAIWRCRSSSCVSEWMTRSFSSYICLFFSGSHIFFYSIHLSVTSRSQ